MFTIGAKPFLRLIPTDLIVEFTAKFMVGSKVFMMLTQI
jgi:hypothetical protein